MLKKFAKIILGTMIGFILFTVVYITYFYFEGYLNARTCLNGISYYVMSENCISGDKVYGEVGHKESVQDKVKKILEDYSNSSWYMKFEINGDNVFGKDGTVSCTYKDVSDNSIDALSYKTAAPKGTVLEVTLKCTLNFKLRYIPRSEYQEPFTLHIPVTVRSNVVGTKYYKGTEDTFQN